MSRQTVSYSGPERRMAPNVQGFGSVKSEAEEALIDAQIAYQDVVDEFCVTIDSHRKRFSRLVADSQANTAATAFSKAVQYESRRYIPRVASIRTSLRQRTARITGIHLTDAA